MFEKEDIKEEHIKIAYNYLKDYCKENKQDLIKFVENKSNINLASEYIHKKLNFALRLILKPQRIANMINDNHEWIVEQAKKIHSK